jgi:hypothetical protein
MTHIPDEHAFGALAALELMANLFDEAQVYAIPPRMVARLIRSLADELCSPEAIAAYRIVSTPGGVEALQSLERDLAMKKVKPC